MYPWYHVPLVSPFNHLMMKFDVSIRLTTQFRGLVGGFSVQPPPTSSLHRRDLKKDDDPNILKASSIAGKVVDFQQLTSPLPTT